MKKTDIGDGWKPDKPYVPLPRILLISAAWQTAGINTHRLIWFLMLEHMNRGAKENGRLVAPRKQLASFGISEHCIGPAIDEASAFGLIDVIRGKGRAPSRYALTWLPLAGALEPTHRWRNYQPAGKSHE
jgi:hypothetical protein